MIKGFKEFVLRGNVIELAVAVAVGTALAALVGAVTASLIEPIVGWLLSLLSGGGTIGGTVTLTEGYELDFTTLIAAFITFFVALAAIYFIFVAPMNKYRELAKGADATPAAPSDIELLTEIRDLLRAQGGSGPDHEAREARRDQP